MIDKALICLPAQWGSPLLIHLHMHFAALFTEERLVSDRQLTDLFNVVDRIGKLAFEFKHHLLH